MKNMKKILSLVLAGVMVLALAACGSNSSKDSSKKETLVMATSADFPPYEYSEDGKIVGIDAELAQAIADKLGMELDIENVAFDSIITGVSSGKYDMGMSGMTATEERKKNVLFSDSYAKAVQAVIVSEDSGITSLDDFYTTDSSGKKTVKDGIKIGVQLGTTGDIYATDTVENDGFTSDHVTEYKTGSDAVLALQTGKVNAVIIDNEPAKSFVKANKGLTILDSPYVEEEYAIAFAKDNTELCKKVNTALNALIKDGTVKKITDKYITAD